MRTRDLVWTALLIALVAVATMVIRVPVPATQGYINMGETMVYLGALLFGPAAGAIAGGVGSALADVLSGYGQFAPYTLVIKAAEGLLVGLVAWRLAGRNGETGRWTVAAVVGIAVGGAVMVGGYYLAETMFLGIDPRAAATEVPGNLFQVLGGLIVAIPAGLLLRRAVAPAR